MGIPRECFQLSSKGGGTTRECLRLSLSWSFCVLQGRCLRILQGRWPFHGNFSTILQGRWHYTGVSSTLSFLILLCPPREMSQPFPSSFFRDTTKAKVFKWIHIFENNNISKAWTRKRPFPEFISMEAYFNKILFCFPSFFILFLKEIKMKVEWETMSYFKTHEQERYLFPRLFQQWKLIIFKEIHRESWSNINIQKSLSVRTWATI